MKRCLYCFEEYPDVFDICPKCGNSVGCLSAEKGCLKPGTLLHQRYLVGFAAGSGGFGIIYRSFDLTLGRTVAVKEFYSSRLSVRSEDGCTLSPSDCRCEEEYNYRKKEFLREARFVSDFEGSCCIPSVLDFFEENGTAYIVMEYLHGKNLSEYIKDGGCSLEFSLYCAIAVCNAAHALHMNGKTHRDIAPDNILICADGEKTGVRLIDFGAARNSGMKLENRDVILKSGFTPPEQYKAGKASPSSDVYSIGAVLYVLLTGESPAAADDRQNGTKELRAPAEKRQDIPRGLNAVVLKAMDMNPLKRYKDAGRLLCELQKIAKSLKISYIEEKIQIAPKKTGRKKALQEEEIRDATEIRGFSAPAPERLLPGTVIGSRYVIGMGYKRMGMCAVYNANDSVLNDKVYVTEFFPKKLCRRDNDGISVISAVNDGSYRDGLALFCSGAEKLLHLDQGPGAEKFDDFFRENGSAYLVSKDMGFFPLSEMPEKKLRDAKLKKMLSDIVVSLEILDKNGLSHGNVSPYSVYTDGEKAYLRFNSALCFPGSSLDGYSAGNRQRYWSAPELSSGTRRVTAEHDRYSLGALAYYLVCGETPVDGAERVTMRLSLGREIMRTPLESGAGISKRMNERIMNSMSLNPSERTGLYEILKENEN